MARPRRGQRPAARAAADRARAGPVPGEPACAGGRDRLLPAAWLRPGRPTVHGGRHRAPGDGAAAGPAGRSPRPRRRGGGDRGGGRRRAQAAVDPQPRARPGPVRPSAGARGTAPVRHRRPRPAGARAAARRPRRPACARAADRAGPAPAQRVRVPRGRGPGGSRLPLGPGRQRCRRLLPASARPPFRWRNGASRPRPCPPAQRRDRRGLGARPVLQRAARAVAVTTFAPVPTPTATRPSPKHVMQVHMPRGYNVARDSITFSETGKSFRISHLPPPYESQTPDVDSLLKQFAQSSQLGANAAYIEDLYEQYLVSPDSVGPRWKAWFDGFGGREAGDVPHSAVAQAVAEAGRLAARGVAVCGTS